ncbi:MAG: hypothetical protein HY553_17995 [Elusimicrobia bacterium]|nr:hypothetical protein [Elusimicrobiota bacterium]
MRDITPSRVALILAAALATAGGSAAESRTPAKPSPPDRMRAVEPTSAQPPEAAENEEPAPAEETAELEPPDRSGQNADIWISIRAVREGRELRLALLTKSGTQANCKFRSASAKADLTANFLPAVNPDKPDQVDFQYQVELADLDPAKRGFSVQGEAEAKAGQPETLFEAEGNSLTVEVRIQEN